MYVCVRAHQVTLTIERKQSREEVSLVRSNQWVHEIADVSSKEKHEHTSCVGTQLMLNYVN